MWNIRHPSRSGYREHASQHGENNIQLSDHDSKHHNVHVVGGGGSSLSRSTIVLNKDWEHGKDSWPANTDTAGQKGIMKTVKITQL